MIELAKARPEDLDFIVEQESRAGMEKYIVFWPHKRHLRQLKDPDCLYLIALEQGRPVGYAILAGLTNVNDSVELARIVVADRGRGLGRELLEAIKKLVFVDLDNHRLWLDVFPENDRARRLYISAGFVEEGLFRDAIRAEDGFRSLIILSMLAGEYFSDSPDGPQAT